MKILINIFLLILMNSEIVFSQDNIDSIIGDIRQKYKLINKNKTLYQTKEEDYDWVRDEVIPGLSEEDLEYEFNEQGTYIAEKITYSNNNKEIFLIVINDCTDLYCEKYQYERHIEYYFWDSELFFCFEQKKDYRQVSYVSNEEKETASEKRIYLHNGSIIRFLTKKIEGEGIWFRENINMQNIKNKSLNVDSLETEDYKIIERYDSLFPYW